MKPYHNGPVPNEARSCTDLFCLIIFIAFSITMFGLGVYAWTAGKFSKLTTPYDPDGKGCGVDYPDYPYIYFASPHADSLYVTVCVKKCPVQADTVLSCQVNSVVTTCSPVANADDTKAVSIYDTTPVTLVCMPTSQLIKNEVMSAIGSSSSAITSLSNNYQILLIAIPVAILLSIIFLLIIRFTAGFFVYLLIIISFASLTALGLYLILVDQSTGFGANISFLQSRSLSITVGVLCLVLALLIVVLFCCFRNRITLASHIISVSARFVDGNLGVLCLPMILFAVMVLFIALWIMEALGYYSLGTPSTSPHQLPFQHFTVSTGMQVLGLVHIFYFFWSMMFLVETSTFIVNGTATSWYFQDDTPYADSSKRYRSFHMGSVALGSFFLALIGFIKFLYELLTPDDDKTEGCLAKWKSFCNCLCFVCVMYIFKCFNSGAYTFIHLSGQSYCSSAWEVVSAKIKEPVTTAVVSVLQIIFSVLIRVGIIALSVFVVSLLISNVQSFKSSVENPSLILAMTGVIAFTISSLFVSVYSDAMDAIFVSYLIDLDAGGEKGSADKCPEELKNFLEAAKKEKGYITN